MPDDNDLNPAESTTADNNSPEDELRQNQPRVAELEGLITRQERELAARDTRISELELVESSLRQVVTDKDSEVATLKQAVAESNDNLSKLDESLKQAIADYKALVIQSNPDIPEELVTGDSIEAIDNSLASAKELISKVRQGMEAEISLARVPAGAPQRTAPDLSALSPREKIQYAIGGFSS